MEITRKRVRESLVQYLCDPCPYCEGSGTVKSRDTIAFELMRELRRGGDSLLNAHVDLLVHPDVADLLETEHRQVLMGLAAALNCRLNVVPRRGLHIEQFEVSGAEP